MKCFAKGRAASRFRRRRCSAKDQPHCCTGSSLAASVVLSSTPTHCRGCSTCDCDRERAGARRPVGALAGRLNAHHRGAHTCSRGCHTTAARPSQSKGKKHPRCPTSGRRLWTVLSQTLPTYGRKSQTEDRGGACRYEATPAAALAAHDVVHVPSGIVNEPPVIPVGSAVAVHIGTRREQHAGSMQDPGPKARCQQSEVAHGSLPRQNPRVILNAQEKSRPLSLRTYDVPVATLKPLLFAISF